MKSRIINKREDDHKIYNYWKWCHNHKHCIGVVLAWLARSTEISAEAKATPVFLFTTSTSTVIKDSVPKLKIDFNNHCSDFD